MAFLYLQAAGSEGIRWHRIFLTGRLRWKEATAAATPASVLISTATFSAAVSASGWRQKRMALVKFSALNLLCGMGDGPRPRDATMLPQNGWL